MPPQAAESYNINLLRFGVWLVFVFSVTALHFECREGCVLYVGGITWEPFRRCGLLSLPLSLAQQPVSCSSPQHKEFHWLSRNISRFIKWKHITEHRSSFTLNGKSLNCCYCKSIITPKRRLKRGELECVSGFMWAVLRCMQVLEFVTGLSKESQPFCYCITISRWHRATQSLQPPGHRSMMTAACERRPTWGLRRMKDRQSLVMRPRWVCVCGIPGYIER